MFVKGITDMALISHTYFRVMAVMPLTTIGWRLYGQMDMYEFSYLDSEIASQFTVFLNRLEFFSNAM